MSKPQKLSVEKVYEIWEDDKGYHFEVGPDRDIGELVQLRYYESGSKPDREVTMTEAEAEHIANCLLSAVADSRAKRAPGTMLELRYVPVTE